MALGFPRPGLREDLEAAGFTVDGYFNGETSIGDAGSWGGRMRARTGNAGSWKIYERGVPVGDVFQFPEELSGEPYAMSIRDSASPDTKARLEAIQKNHYKKPVIEFRDFPGNEKDLVTGSD
jgi:hypothetical protein